MSEGRTYFRPRNRQSPPAVVVQGNKLGFGVAEMNGCESCGDGAQRQIMNIVQRNKTKEDIGLTASRRSACGMRGSTQGNDAPAIEGRLT